MEGRTSNLVVIDSDGNAFVDVDYLDKIPTFSPDEPVRDRFFSEIVDVAIPGPAMLPHNSHNFVSLNYLNMLLASAQTNPLHVRVIAEETREGYLKVLLRLEDSNGNELLTGNQNVDREESVPLVAQEQGMQKKHARRARFEDNYMERHDTPHEDEHVEGQPTGFIQNEDDQEPLGDDDRQEGQLSQHRYTDVEDNNDLEITPLRPQLPGESTVEATPSNPQGQRGQDRYFQTLLPTPYTEGRPYDRALVRQLRELRMTDRTSLSALVHNQLPPALNLLREAQHDLIHLATLSNGHVCSVKIFRDLRARREDLSFPSLGDPGRLDKPITAYQKNELVRILQAVAATESGQKLWSLAPGSWPDVWHEYSRTIQQPMDLSTLVQKLLQRSYRTMMQFRRGVDLLVENALACSDETSVFTATCKLAVDEIHRMVEGICAIQDVDILDTLSNGMLREVVISATVAAGDDDNDNDAALTATSLRHHHPSLPRFVLPLGRLYRADNPTEPPQPFHGFVLMDVTTPRKALWLYVLSRGKECCSLVMLADDIALWELGSSNDNRDGGLMMRMRSEGGGGGGGTRHHRARLTNTYPDSRIKVGAGKVLFKRADRIQAAEAIKSGWGIVPAAAGSFSRQGPEASPIQIALRNSVALTRKTPTKSPFKRRRVNGGDKNGLDDGSDEDWEPSERRNAKRRMIAK